ncbi:Pyrimidodiazepine synthase [Trichoplax sp. H2]|uniref:Glutathione S-transferase omega n=1 Tax=Trichoplax adhaerens TaxID=10228 RepID=B3SDJ8_TRIAD|nr:hypothetical protein TRIADDRAFT_62357 [Trichoplax adhaerens]EDV19190.1 hypothetical protein TRIADDRAFT_62357 [Trichoplax adhaerens]RDD38959.1 Pyrimidodiazepine synthase [Trichoplax sp. H2]|eukprot:XP_002118310.1 hypothetical protein TRIADDRAFT_62357 [Trichoplax adhaerens]
MAQIQLLTKGSERPPKSSKVRLYGARFDTHSAGIRYVLRDKGIDFEDVYIHTFVKPEWYEDINPVGKIPCVEYGDEIVPETFVIYDYLEEKFPSKGSQQMDAYKRSMDRVFMVRCAEFLTPKIIDCMKNAKDNLASLEQALLKVNDILLKRGTHYFGGSSPNYVDYYLWSWVEVMPVMIGLHGVKLELDKEKYTTYLAWIDRMDKNEHVEKDRLERKVNFETRTEYLKSLLAGRPNPTIGL